MWPWDEVEVRRVLGIAEAATHGEFPQVHFGWCWLASSASLDLHALSHYYQGSQIHCLHARLVAITYVSSQAYNNS
jgi:hypothetical protein